ncbi:MAG: HAD hydrolase family protein [Planctomycetaceae bacterium]|nr:HAD hydrolase family protein [Planctomycetaceae bacterium]
MNIPVDHRDIADLLAITLVLSDVDGVLTDGGIGYSDAGQEFKQFHVRDGLGIKLWRIAGGQFGLLTARSSPLVDRRAKELGVDFLVQGQESKLGQARKIWRGLGLDSSQVCYIGDDLTDLPVLQAVGWSATVSDGAPEVKSVARSVTSAPGGRGAVRELLEFILRAQGRWDATIGSYLKSLEG